MREKQTSVNTAASIPTCNLTLPQTREKIAWRDDQLAGLCMVVAWGFWSCMVLLHGSFVLHVSWKWPNTIQYSAECYLIFASILASRSNTSTLNHHFFASPTIWVRHHIFGIRFDDESRSVTLLRWYLGRST